MTGAIDGVWRNQTLKAGEPSRASPARSSTSPPELLTEREAAAVLGIGQRKFHQLRAEAWFPQAIELGPRALRWSRTELLAALSTRAPRRTVQAEPEHFQKARARKGLSVGMEKNADLAYVNKAHQSFTLDRSSGSEVL